MRPYFFEQESHASPAASRRLNLAVGFNPRWAWFSFTSPAASRRLNLAVGFNPRWA
jgi:hypothetical protein